MTMSFLLVITLATVALAVPGYLHDSEVAFNLSTIQSLQHQQQNSSRKGFHTQENPVKNWKDENFRYSQPVPHSVRYKKSFGQSYVLTGFNAQAQHTQRAVINSNVSENVDQNQASPLQTTAGNTQSNSPLASFNNNHESSSPAGIDKKAEPAQRLKASSKPNKYNGFKSVSPISYYSLNSGGKTGVQSSPGFVSYNQGFGQDQTLQGSAPVSNSYMKKSNVRPASKNRYMHVLTTFAGTNQKFDLASSLLPEIKITDVNKNNAYTQTVSSSALKTYNNVYVKERGSSLLNSNFNNEKENIGILRSSASSGLDFSLSDTSSGGNEHDVFGTRVTNSSFSAVIPSAGQPQATQGPIYVDLKQEIMKVSQLGSSLGDGYQNILATGGSVNALSEKKINSAMKFTSEGIPKLMSPIIHKHIFFHVPPPDLAESIKVIPSAKKTYNILFIKGPQDLDSNLQKSNEVPHRKDVAVDDKTLIYVLLKNSEDTNKIILPKPKPTAQQVFFVKYNDLQQDIASQVNDELDKNESIDNIVPLGPDLVNGQQD